MAAEHRSMWQKVPKKTVINAEAVQKTYKTAEAIQIFNSLLEIGSPRSSSIELGLHLV